MHAFGGSVVVAAAGDILKIHVHTDSPEAVFSYAARWGRVETTKADDMRAQHRRLAHPKRRPVAVVADSSADLPDPVLDRHHIALVPLQVVFGDETFRDRVELKPEDFYRRLRQAQDLPTTSQPAPADFVRVFRDARAEADDAFEDRRAALTGCLDKLPAPQRRVVERYYDAVSVEELAADAGQSREAIYKTLQRVRRTLFDCINAALGEGGAA